MPGMTKNAGNDKERDAADDEGKGTEWWMAKEGNR